MAPWRERVLDLWAAGKPYRDIMADTGKALGSVSACISLARKAGDPRAAKHPKGRQAGSYATERDAVWGLGARLGITAPPQKRQAAKEQIAASMRHASRTMRLPPLTQAEADALVARHIAEKGVTRLPGPSQCGEGNNWAVGWK